MAIDWDKKNYTKDDLLLWLINRYRRNRELYQWLDDMYKKKYEEIMKES